MHGFKWNFLLTQLFLIVKISFLCTCEPTKLNQIFNSENTPDENEESFNRYCGDSSLEKWKSGSVLRKYLCANRGRTYSDMISGYRVSLTFCQQRMKDERWNCSLDFGVREKIKAYSDGVLPFGLQGTKQAAFYYSITRATMAYSITESCLNDHNLSCACKQTEPEPWETSSHFPQANLLSNITLASRFLLRYGDCGNANVMYGIKHSEQNLEEGKLKQSRERRKSRFDRINLINADMGRKVYRSMSRIVCKCHGTSGTCTAVHCWRRHPSIRALSIRLKEMYDKAKDVSKSQLNKIWKGFLKGRRVTKLRLIYFKKTPPLCSRSYKLGIKGVAGRIIHSSANHDFCCANGKMRSKETFTESCNCQFVWCCRVQCDQCITERVTHVCRPEPGANR